MKSIIFTLIFTSFQWASGQGASGDEMGQLIAEQSNLMDKENRELCGETKSLADHQNWPEVKDQGKHGWCYSYAVADYLSFHSGKDYSPSHMALTSEMIKAEKEGRDPSRPYGGTINELFENIKAQSICSEKEFPSQTEAFSAVMGSRLKEDYDMISQLSPEELRKVQPQTCSVAASVLGRSFPTLKSNMMNVLSSASGEGRLFEAAKKACSKEKERPFINSKMTWSNDVLGAVKLLDQGKPAIVVYSVGEVLDQPLDEQQGDFHASTLIGKRWNEKEKQCQFLIRNTWGKHCSSWAPAHGQCDEKGNVWLNSSRFDPKHTAIYHME